MKFCEELLALHGTEALLQGLDGNGLLFRLNGVTFDVWQATNSNGHNIVSEIRLHPDQTVTINKPKMTSGVRVVLNPDQFMLNDLWVDHVHLRYRETNTRQIKPIEVNFLDPNRSWPKRSSLTENGDYIGTREYDMLVGELAGTLKEQMRQEAAERIAKRKAQAKAEQEAFAKLVTRDDLSEDNPAWGNW